LPGPGLIAFPAHERHDDVKESKGKAKKAQPKTNASNPSMKGLIDKIPAGGSKKPK